MGRLLHTPEQGVDTLVWLAADDVPLESHGQFWLNRPRSPHKLRFTRTRDTADRRRQLWQWVTETSGHEPAGPESA
jgi:DNA polymerase III psi subunit